MDRSRFLTVAEVAQLLRVSPRTLEAWARGPRPRVPSLRIGRRILFDRDSLERWIGERVTGQQE